MLLDWYLILHWDYIDKFKSILNSDLGNYIVITVSWVTNLEFVKQVSYSSENESFLYVTQPVVFAFAGIDGLFDGKHYFLNM